MSTTENEYVVMFKDSYQYSHDEWKTCNRTLKVTDKTTVKEIRDFYLKHLPNGNVEVTLSQLETI